eukprot:1158580-Pelagomonas_calceolata.AAC.3
MKPTHIPSALLNPHLILRTPATPGTGAGPRHAIMRHPQELQQPSSRTCTNPTPSLPSHACPQLPAPLTPPAPAQPRHPLALQKEACQAGPAAAEAGRYGPPLLCNIRSVTEACPGCSIGSCGTGGCGGSGASPAGPVGAAVPVGMMRAGWLCRSNRLARRLKLSFRLADLPERCAMDALK